MKGGHAVLLCTCLGCGHHATPILPSLPVPIKPPPFSDPISQMYQHLRTANNDLDVALGNLEDGMTKASGLAKTLEGRERHALEDVSELMNGAGEALSDYDDMPSTLDEFRRDFSQHDENRLRGITAAIKALREVDSASDILDDLGSLLPPAERKSLQDISDEADSAADNLKDAVKQMGGKVPTDLDDSGSHG